MIQKLKIKVKETIEEKRPLNDAEREIYDIYHMNGPSLEIGNEIVKFWKSQGFLYSLYDGNEGTFKKEIIREATPREIALWIVKDSPYDINRNILLIPFKDRIYAESRLMFKDKEIILELENGD